MNGLFLRTLQPSGSGTSRYGGIPCSAVWNSGRPLEEKDLGRIFGGDRAPSLDGQQGLGLGLEHEEIRRVCEAAGLGYEQVRQEVTADLNENPDNRPEQRTEPRLENRKEK